MKRTTITFDKMADRQDLIGIMETRKLGLEPYMMDRTDMYWARVKITDEGMQAELIYCIDRDYGVGSQYWHLSFQYGAAFLNTQGMQDSVLNKWYRSGEYKQALQWWKNLDDAGYTTSLGGEDRARCPHCNGIFARGTSHPHAMLSAEFTGGKPRVIHHHGKMQVTIEEMGLTKLGRSGFDPDMPSLEEQGKLEPVTV